MTATQQPSVTQALKPCPFCGGSANNPLHNDEWDVYALNCSQCDSGTSAETAAEAIEAWNTRHREASTAELRAENERLGKLASLALAGLAHEQRKTQELRELLSKVHPIIPETAALAAEIRAALSTQTSAEGGE